jgi:histidine triad (HIT) family protein
MLNAPEGNIFGMILAGEIPSYEVYSDEACYAFLDIYPQAPGHTLVIPRSFSPHIGAATPEDLAACVAAVQMLIPAILEATGSGGASVISNMGKDAGQMIEYMHFHIIPRRQGDEVSLYTIGPIVGSAELAAIQEKIRAAL